MTRKELVAKHMPKMINNRTCGGVMYCPDNEIYKEIIPVREVEKVKCNGFLYCTGCWNTEIEESEGDNMISENNFNDGFENATKGIAEFKKVSMDQYVKDVEKCDIFISDFVLVEYDNLIHPERKTKGSAGYDFHMPTSLIIRPGETVLFPTGFKCKIENGYFLQLVPRSSLGFKYRLRLENTIGIIDSDYFDNKDNEGHIWVKMTNEGNEILRLDSGESYMQGIFLKYYVTTDDSVSRDRVGGIGSTNN